MIREGLPPAIAMTGVVTVWAAHHFARHPSEELSVAVSWFWLPLTVTVFVTLWISHRGIR